MVHSAYEANRYRVSLEVAGPLAMFARPDTGANPTSYPLPTWSAAKGIFEAIAFLADGKAWIRPSMVEICRRVGKDGGQIGFQRYTTNYGGPLRKADVIRKGSSFQFFATVLRDVCYRLYGVIEGERTSGETNPRHYLKDLFERRIRQGKCFRTPCLGWSEFTCSYWGPFREGITEVDPGIRLKVPSMLLGVWDQAVAGEYSPEYGQEIEVAQGVLQYAFRRKHGDPVGIEVDHA